MLNCWTFCLLVFVQCTVFGLILVFNMSQIFAGRHVSTFNNVVQDHCWLITRCLNSGDWDTCLQNFLWNRLFVMQTCISISGAEWRKLSNNSVFKEHESVKAVVSATPLQTGTGRRQVTALQHGSRLSCACSTAVTPRCSHTAGCICYMPDWAGCSQINNEE